MAEAPPRPGAETWTMRQARAEEIVDRLGEQLRERAVRVAARAREEAEDLWAEARARSARDGNG